MNRSAIVSIATPLVLATYLSIAMPAIAHPASRITGTITGTLREAGSGKPLQYANVFLVGTTMGSMSLSDGQYRIENVPYGRYRLRAMMMGYKNGDVDDVVVEAGRTTHVDVSLGFSWGPAEAERRSLVGIHTDATGDDLTCEIVPVDPPFHVGDAPTFHVRIHNISRKSFYLVRAVDGSNSAARYPHVWLKIDGPKRGGRRPVGCASVNPLQGRDFVRADPGATFEPFDVFVSNDLFAQPGTYTVTFEYSTDDIDYGDWIDRMSSQPPLPGILSMLSKVPRVTIKKSMTVSVAE